MVPAVFRTSDETQRNILEADAHLVNQHGLRAVRVDSAIRQPSYRQSPTTDTLATAYAPGRADSWLASTDARGCRETTGSATRKDAIRLAVRILTMALPRSSAVSAILSSALPTLNAPTIEISNPGGLKPGHKAGPCH